LICIVASPLLRIFGDSYAASGATTLRLLALGAVPASVVAVGLVVLRLRGDVWHLAALQAFGCVVLLGGSYALLPSHGIAGVGVAFLLANVTTAVILCVTVLRRLLLRPLAHA
jgi:O-antigen/teichoic acid export membrane protein